MRYLWPAAFCLSSLWAGIATYKYVQLKNNPLIMSVKSGAESDLIADSKSLTQMERLSFVREFVERYVSFEPDSFWQGQTALSFLMAPTLREQRLAEVSRLRDKIQKNHIIQHGKILSVQERQGEYQVTAEVSLSEGKSSSHLMTHLNIKLGESARSLENPWGLMVSDLKFAQVESEGAFPFSGRISTHQDQPSLLHFPCAVENFEIPPDVPVKVKITTLNVSEIQLYLTKAYDHEAALKAFCKGSEFDLSMSSQKDFADLFTEIPESSGKIRLASTAPSKKKPKAKSAYRKTIEDELGFVIEE